jgi:hypothetical protein
MNNTKVGSIGGLIGVLIGVLFAVVWNRTHLPPASPMAQVAAVANVTTTQTVSDHTVTHTVVTKPDGTVTDTTTQNNVEVKDVQKIRTIQTKFKLGLRTEYDFNTRRFTYTGEFSRRIYGGVWGDIGYNPQLRQVTAGFSYEF